MLLGLLTGCPSFSTLGTARTLPKGKGRGVAFVEQHLTLQVRDLNEVTVDDAHEADAGPDEVMPVVVRHLAELLEEETLPVNSMHHQGIRTLGAAPARSVKSPDCSVRSRTWPGVTQTSSRRSG